MAKKTFSNNLLVMLLIGAMIIALTGSVFSMHKLGAYNDFVTGAFGLAGNETRARINFTINETLAIQFTHFSVDWTTGYVDPDIEVCTLDTEGTRTGCMGFADVTDPLRLKNVGNQAVILEMKNMGHNASSWIGGNNPEYALKWSQDVGGTIGVICANYTELDGYDWYGASYDSIDYTLNDFTRFCDAFNYQDGQDELIFNFEVQIPMDASPGPRGDVWTAQALALS